MVIERFPLMDSSSSIVVVDESLSAQLTSAPPFASFINPVSASLNKHKQEVIDGLTSRTNTVIFRCDNLLKEMTTGHTQLKKRKSWVLFNKG